MCWNRSRDWHRWHRQRRQQCPPAPHPTARARTLHKGHLLLHAGGAGAALGQQRRLLADVAHQRRQLSALRGWPGAGCAGVAAWRGGHAGAAPQARRPVLDRAAGAPALAVAARWLCLHSLARRALGAVCQQGVQAVCLRGHGLDAQRRLQRRRCHQLHHGRSCGLGPRAPRGTPEGSAAWQAARGLEEGLRQGATGGH